jgi:hypothetical protein
MVSPHFSDGTPMTAASATAGWLNTSTSQCLTDHPRNLQSRRQPGGRPHRHGTQPHRRQGALAAAMAEPQAWRRIARQLSGGWTGGVGDAAPRRCVSTLCRGWAGVAAVLTVRSFLRHRWPLSDARVRTVDQSGSGRGWSLTSFGRHVLMRQRLHAQLWAQARTVRCS